MRTSKTALSSAFFCSKFDDTFIYVMKYFFSIIVFMKDFCVLSDFDGTITNKDGLYTFIETYAEGDWQKIENDWIDGKISSKECLTEEFKMVPNLSEELIGAFIEDLSIDESFIDFYKNLLEQEVDFYIVSDGIDYFINRILAKYELYNINIIANHGEFRGEFFEITFPNDSHFCQNNAGTCKCQVLRNLKNQYKKIWYIGDGVSDFCVSDKADLLFAKSSLHEYCKKNNINHIKFNDFNDILKNELFFN